MLTKVQIVALPLLWQRKYGVHPTDASRHPDGCTPKKIRPHWSEDATKEIMVELLLPLLGACSDNEDT